MRSCLPYIVRGCPPLTLKAMRTLSSFRSLFSVIVRDYIGAKVFWNVAKVIRRLISMLMLLLFGVFPYFPIVHSVFYNTAQWKLILTTMFVKIKRKTLSNRITNIKLLKVKISKGIARVVYCKQMHLYIRSHTLTVIIIFFFLCF